MTEQEMRSLFFAATNKLASTNHEVYRGFKIGMQLEREACASSIAAVCGYGDSEDFAEIIRARGQHD